MDNEAYQLVESDIIAAVANSLTGFLRHTLGVLREIEGMVKRPLHEQFELIFGTSTGAIIAALLALGKSVKEISDLYEEHAPTVMQKRGRAEKSNDLQRRCRPHFPIGSGSCRCKRRSCSHGR